MMKVLRLWWGNEVIFRGKGTDNTTRIPKTRNILRLSREALKRIESGEMAREIYGLIRELTNESGFYSSARLPKNRYAG
jgi:hypothetical protein